jgi:hypothetical protein
MKFPGGFDGERAIVRGFAKLASLFRSAATECVSELQKTELSEHLRVATIFPKVVRFCLRMTGETGIVSASSGGQFAQLIFEN